LPTSSATYLIKILAKMCSGRHSGVSLFEQIVNCSSCFCPLVTVNLAIILHGRLKIGMTCQHPNNFRIIDVDRLLRQVNWSTLSTRITSSTLSLKNLRKLASCN
jgi:hypothetical protein